MNDLEASIGLEGIENFWKTFDTRKDTMYRFRMACLGFDDVAWFSEEDARDFNCPHGFSVTTQKEGDIQKVIDCLDRYNIHWKRNFGCIPTQHAAFSDMGYSLGDFPNAEWVGENGIHIGCHQYLSEEDIVRVETALNEALGSL
jgi:dTDP-4-amino-4,6-dideoxygalactose transaminase